MNTPEPIKAGLKTDFSDLVDQYKDAVYNTALSVVQNNEDAEDITQEVFMRVYQNDGFRQESSFSTWIYRITINASLDHEKKKKRIKYGGGLMSKFSQGTDKEPTEFYHPGIAAENREKGAILFRAISKLPGNQKIAFILQRMENRTVKEIAEITGNSVAAIESLLGRARLNLKKELKSYYETNLK